MCRIAPEDAGARQQVKRFCELVRDLREVHGIVKEIETDGQFQELMGRTAGEFFHKTFEILKGYCRLEVCKLTDPASSAGGRFPNFTIANILEGIDWPEKVSNKLTDLYGPILRFRAHILEARNKLDAHYDKETVRREITLGAFPEGEDEKLMEVLEELCNVLHKASLGEVFGDTRGAGQCVLDLKRALTFAVTFDKFLKQSKGDEKHRLVRCLGDVNRGDF